MCLETRIKKKGTSNGCTAPGQRPSIRAHGTHLQTRTAKAQIGQVIFPEQASLISRITPSTVTTTTKYGIPVPRWYLVLTTALQLLLEEKQYRLSRSISCFPIYIPYNLMPLVRIWVQLLKYANSPTQDQGLQIPNPQNCFAWVVPSLRTILLERKLQQVRAEWAGEMETR